MSVNSSTKFNRRAFLGLCLGTLTSFAFGNVSILRGRNLFVYYTREGLDLRFRELLTFVFVASLGGADAQVKAHIQGNLNIGNDRARLIATLTALVPYIGYPRVLNALGAMPKA